MGERQKRVPTEQERKNFIAEATYKAVRKGQYVDAYVGPATATAPAAPVGTAVAAYSEHSSAASDKSREEIESEEYSPRFSNVTDDTVGEQLWEKVIPSSRSGYSDDAPPVSYTHLTLPTTSRV